MVFSGSNVRLAPRLTATVAAAVAWGSTYGCGVADTELFGQSNAALVEHMGQACELEALGENETVVEDEHPLCEPGYCVGQGGQPWTEGNVGICTCRCAGPEGTGPMCECGDAFECRHLIDGVGLGGAHLEGSYCVPRD